MSGSFYPQDEQHTRSRDTYIPHVLSSKVTLNLYTGYTQKNGAVSKVNKKCISHLSRAQPTPSAAATVQVSHALPAVHNSAQNSHCTVIADLDTSKRSTQKAFSCCDAILETGPAVSMGSKLLVAYEKLEQLSLLTVYVLPV
jgi:hypothetical protein